MGNPNSIIRWYYLQSMIWTTVTFQNTDSDIVSVLKNYSKIRKAELVQNTCWQTCERLMTSAMLAFTACTQPHSDDGGLRTDMVDLVSSVGFVSSCLNVIGTNDHGLLNTTQVSFLFLSRSALTLL